MGGRFFFLGLAGGSLLLFLGVGRPLDVAPPVLGRSIIMASMERFMDIPTVR